MLNLSPMKQLVVLSGAGISAESGLRTFRDSNGLWEQHRIEDVATPEAWIRHPERVLDFYNQRRKQALAARPNSAHTGLVALQEKYFVHIITQNVDHLHEAAGSKNVLHLHGSLFSKCSDTDSTINTPVFEDMPLGEKAPDGGNWRPDIVWFGEAVELYSTAKERVQNADILIVIGTSLQVYPAAGLVHEAPYGTPIYVIDPEPGNPINRFTTLIPKKATEGMADLLSLL